MCERELAGSNDLADCHRSGCKLHSRSTKVKGAFKRASNLLFIRSLKNRVISTAATKDLSRQNKAQSTKGTAHSCMKFSSIG